MATRVKIFRTLSLSLLFVITFSVALVTTGLAQSPDETPVAFPDANLEAAIRDAIDKTEGLIFTSDLDGLTSLKTKGITDLTGLEHCTYLTELRLGSNEISDISFLSSLTSLTSLELPMNQISGISPLSSLTSLIWLDLGVHNQISDISPLANLVSLTWLSLWVTRINDISPLEKLVGLSGLELGHTQISDISPLANLTSLTWLRLEDNQIGDISPLLDNEGLSEGDAVLLSGNPLNTDSINTYIPQLEARGVDVSY